MWLRLLKSLFQLLRRVALRIGHVNTTLLLGLSYYLILLPISLIRRTVSRPRQSPGWIDREPLPPNHFEKQH